MKAKPSAPDQAVPAEVGRLLDKILADECVIYATTYDYYWNVTGPNFTALNELLEELYEASQERLRTISERARSGRLWAHGSLMEPAKVARLFFRPGMGMPADEMLVEVVALHEDAARQIRADCTVCARLNEGETAVFLRELMKAHRRTASRLRAVRLGNLADGRQTA